CERAVRLADIQSRDVVERPVIADRLDDLRQAHLALADAEHVGVEGEELARIDGVVITADDELRLGKDLADHSAQRVEPLLTQEEGRADADRARVAVARLDEALAPPGELAHPGIDDLPGEAGALEVRRER